MKKWSHVPYMTRYYSNLLLESTHNLHDAPDDDHETDLVLASSSSLIPTEEDETDPDEGSTILPTQKNGSHATIRKKKTRHGHEHKNWFQKNTTFPITRQTEENAHILFESIAPHVELDDLLGLQSKFNDFIHLLQEETNLPNDTTSQKQIYLDRYLTLMGQIHAILKHTEKCRGDETKGTTTVHVSKKKQKEYHLKLKSLRWVESLLAQFFAGPTGGSTPTDRSTSDTHVTKKATSSHSTIMDNSKLSSLQRRWLKDPSYPPNKNRVNFQKNVQRLMKVREVYIESLSSLSLSTSTADMHKNIDSKHPKSKSTFKECNTTGMSDRNSHIEKVRIIHYMKSAETLKSETESILSILADRLPSLTHDQVLKVFFETFPTLTEKDSSTSALFTQLQQCATFHIHTIATDLAEFFYMEPPLHLCSSASSDTTVMGSSTHVENSAIRSKTRKNSKSWNDVHDDFLRTFLTAQHAYTDYNEKRAAEQEKTSKHIHDTNNEELIETFLTECINSDANLSEEAKNVTTENTLHSKERQIPKRYVTFNTIILSDDFGLELPHSSSLSNMFATQVECQPLKASNLSQSLVTPPTEKLVFIDNLPIDITEDEIRTLYSRCGPLQSVKIFNLKLELDPGEVKKGKQKQLLKNSRFSGVKAADSRHRQRSPVYAKLQFENLDGYKMATMDALRIFGMVIRFHPVRSIPAKMMKTLYIEDIPFDLRSIVMEQKLSKLLQPHMRLSLELGYNHRQNVRNCIIRFPSFESCHYAFHLLECGDFCNDSNGGMMKLEGHVNWLKTPDNAMEYWTRKVLVEP